ncbi:MAG: GSCFA domain-containing protein [Prevotellaceae bacterium]|nr:GSCFA domain-containing protein [Prevotellaceae bacterium]
MEFRTIVDIERPAFQIEPMERMLFVGSCFAANIGQRFVDNKFRAVVNPYGVMYNPASILHTVEKVVREGTFVPRIVFFTLGTNHVYRLKETGEIVDNCQKRPARLFQEEELSVDECADYIMQAVRLLLSVNPDVHIVLTVSPIRYAKYGYHKSQLSKATLLLAAEKCITNSTLSCLHYFPSYEIVNDELRDYRFYREDMLHPTDQAVEYIWQRLQQTCFSPAALRWLDEWKPVREALNHRPFNPDSPEHKAFVEKTQKKIEDLKARYPDFIVVLASIFSTTLQNALMFLS